MLFLSKRKRPPNYRSILVLFHFLSLISHSELLLSLFYICIFDLHLSKKKNNNLSVALFTIFCTLIVVITVENVVIAFFIFIFTFVIFVVFTFTLYCTFLQWMLIILSTGIYCATQLCQCAVFFCCICCCRTYVLACLGGIVV